MKLIKKAPKKHRFKRKGQNFIRPREISADVTCNGQNSYQTLEND